MFPLKQWFEANRAEHTAAWFNDIVRFIRWNMKPLVSLEDAKIGMDYLMCRQDMSFIEDLFQNPAKQNLNNKNPRSGLINTIGQPISRHANHDKFLQSEMAGLNFAPLPIPEKLRNIIISENKKMGIVVNVRAEDPTSTEDRKNDKALIQNGKSISNFLSYIYTSIGQRPYSLQENEIRFGDKHDAGNTQEFYSMGMDEGDPSDVEFFFKMFHKLDQEIAAQEPIDYVFNYNQVMDKIVNWTNDELSKKAIAARQYISDVTGALVVEYVPPETVFIYGAGSRPDYNDANAKVIERRYTIKQTIDMLGNAFDIEKEWSQLLVAISYANGVDFTDINNLSYRGWVDSKYTALKGSGGTVYGYNEFMNFKILVGYVEASSQVEANGANTVKDDGTFYQNNQPEAKYQAKARYETPTYCCYYIAVSAVDQIMFKYGLVPYQDIEGYNDWCSNFTILTWKEVGQPLIVTCIPFLDLINEAFYKFKYEIRRALPAGTEYNYDSLASIAMDLIPDTSISKQEKIMKVIELFDGSPDRISKFPEVDGKIVPIPGNQLNTVRPNGLTKESLQWWDIIIGAWDKMLDMAGISPLRYGDPGAPRDSMNNQFKALEYSEASTYYVPDMLTFLFRQMAVRTMFFVQDIIHYKNHNTLAYKFLVDAVGQDCLDKLEGLGKKAMHRWGIFVESLNQLPLRNKLEAVLLEAVKTKAITAGEYLLIQDIKSPKRAFQVFAYFEQRNKKIAQRDAMQLQQAQQEGLIELEKEKQRTIMLEGEYMLAGRRIDAEADIQGKLITQQGGISKAAMKVEADRGDIYHQANANILEQQQNLNNTGKTTPPMMQPMMPGMQSSPLAATPGAPDSGLEQLRQNAEPQPSDTAITSAM